MERGGLPDPLVPPEVDLRGFEFMPYYGDRLRDSDLNSRATDAEYRAAHNLWWSSWKQIPAASLPSDDLALCKLADLGRDMKTWLQVKARALHGFLLCNDNRYYHLLISMLALQAWDARSMARARGKAGATKRWNGQSNAPIKEPDRASIDSDRPSTNLDRQSNAPTTKNDSKGKERTVKTKQSESYGLLSEGTLAGATAKILRSLGVQITPSNPLLLDWLALGLTEGIARDAVSTARFRKPGTQPISAGYLSPIVLEILNPEKKSLAQLKAKPWYIASWSAIVDKGKSLGIEQAAGELAPDFRARVYAAAGVTEEQLRKAEAEFRA